MKNKKYKTILIVFLIVLFIVILYFISLKLLISINLNGEKSIDEYF